MSEIGCDYLRNLYDDARRTIDGLEAITEVSITIAGLAPRGAMRQLAVDEASAVLAARRVLAAPRNAGWSAVSMRRHDLERLVGALERLSSAPV